MSFSFGCPLVCANDAIRAPPHVLLRNCSTSWVGSTPSRSASAPCHARVRGAVLLRRLAHDVAEGAAEGAQAGEADGHADVGDRAVGRAQQRHRALDPAALQVAVRGLAERRPEGPDEVRLRHVRDPRQRRDVERVGELPVHRVAGAQHPAVLLLGLAAHGAGRGTRSSPPGRWGAGSRRCRRRRTAPSRRPARPRPRAGTRSARRSPRPGRPARSRSGRPPTAARRPGRRRAARSSRSRPCRAPPS